MSFLKEIGLGKADLVIKSDQEAAVGALVDDIKRMRSDSRTVVEHSPIRAPKSNGLIERTVMNIKEQAKVISKRDGREAFLTEMWPHGSRNTRPFR